MTLEDISEGIVTISHKNVAIATNAPVTLLAGVAGKRLKIFSMILSTGTQSSFTFRTGNEGMVTIYMAANTVININSRTPILVGDTGDAVTITASAAALSANVYIQYRLES